MKMTLSPEKLFHSLSDATRLRVLALLTNEDELCVCELTHALGVSQPMISRHLASLRKAGLVSGRRAGVWIHYRLHPALPRWARAVLRETLRGNPRHRRFRSDRATLKSMSNRPKAGRCP